MIKGSKHSEQTLKKLSITKLGKKRKPFTEETRQKMSEVHKGEKGYWYGKKLSEEHRRKIGEVEKGEKNNKWKGDDVGYSGLHKWINRYLPKPKDGKCMLCHINLIKHSACITEIYNRDFKNWAWFCESCHNKWDNISIRAWITKRSQRNL